MRFLSIEQWGEPWYGQELRLTQAAHVLDVAAVAGDHRVAFDKGL